MAKQDCIGPLTRAGIAYEDAVQLRRIAMTLDRWHELECGNSNNHVSYAIERDGDEPDSKPYMVYHPHDGGKCHRHPVADREQGALKRLKAIMAKYPAHRAYVQGDPRGASLYILRPEQVREGEPLDSYYSSGVAVFK